MKKNSYICDYCGQRFNTDGLMIIPICDKCYTKELDRQYQQEIGGNF